MTFSVSATWSGGGPPLQHFDLLKAQTTWADEDVQSTVLPLLKNATPKRTGAMALKETSRRVDTSGGGVTVQFAAHSSYAPFVVYGARPHEIWPVAANALHFFGSRGEVFVGPRGSSAHVNHPGNRPNDFPRRVLDAVKDDLSRALAERIRDQFGGTD